MLKQLHHRRKDMQENIFKLFKLFHLFAFVILCVFFCSFSMCFYIKCFLFFLSLFLYLQLMFLGIRQPIFLHITMYDGPRGYHDTMRNAQVPIYCLDSPALFIGYISAASSSASFMGIYPRNSGFQPRIYTNNMVCILNLKDPLIIYNSINFQSLSRFETGPSDPESDDILMCHCASLLH